MVEGLLVLRPCYRESSPSGPACGVELGFGTRRTGRRFPAPPESRPPNAKTRLPPSAHFSPDGGRVAIGTSNGTVIVRAGDHSRETLRFSPRPGNGIRSIEFSRDGGSLLICYDDGEIGIHDGESGKPVTSLGSRSPRVDSVFFDGDGRHMFAVCTANPSGSQVVESHGPATGLSRSSVAILDAESCRKQAPSAVTATR